MILFIYFEAEHRSRGLLGSNVKALSLAQNMVFRISEKWLFQIIEFRMIH